MRGGCWERFRKGRYHSIVKKRATAFLLAALISGRALAAGLPDLGEVGAGDLSPLAERRVGEQAMHEIRHESAYVDDPEVASYLNRLGLGLAAHAPSSSQNFSFFAVRDGTLNAFALPGGFIGVHTGLIVSAQSESELASVLGHEIAHVTQRHIAQMVGNQGRTGLILLASLIVAVLAANSNPQAAEAAIATGSAAGLQSQLSYSRDFEREADRVGLQILDAAGFDVRGMASFFERLQRNSRLYENNAPVYMRTHPLTTERISDIENRIHGLRYRQVPDSRTFGFVRAKLVVDGGDVGRVAERLEVLKDESAEVRGYAGALAALRAGRLDEAARKAKALAAEAADHPMIRSLEGEILRTRGQWEAAVEHYRSASERFPDQPALVYGRIESLLGAGRPADAVALLRTRLTATADDSQLWSMMARAQAQAGSNSGRHRAQAEVYRLQGALSAAVEQLELARRAGDADFYDASAIDSRLRTLRRELEQERQEQKAARG